MDQQNSATSSMLEKNLDHLPVKSSRKSLDVILGVLAVFLVGLSAFLYFENTSLKKQLGITPKPLLPKSCEYEGVTYKPGDGFTATDGCNSCSCSETGEVACTLMACEQSSSGGSIANWSTYNDPQNRFSFQYPPEMFLIRDNPGDIEISTSENLEETAMTISVASNFAPDILTIASEAPPGVFEQLAIQNLFTKYPSFKKLYAGNPPWGYHILAFPSENFELGNLYITIRTHNIDDLPASEGGYEGQRYSIISQILSTFEFTN